MHDSVERRVHRGARRHEQVDTEVHRARLELSAFGNWMSGYIYLFPEAEPRVTIRGTFPAFRYTQTDAWLRGFDGWFEYSVLDFVDLGIRGSRIRGDDRSADQPLVSMPADRITLSAHVRLPEGRILAGPQFDVEWSAVRRQDHFPDGVDYADPPPGYSLVNVGFRTELVWGTTPVLLSLRVENVLNTAYRDYLSRFRYFVDDPGRNVALRIRIPFGRTDG